MDCGCEIKVEGDSKGTTIKRWIIFCPLHASAEKLRYALEAFVDYYDQAGIVDALETDDDEGPFDGDERFNVRQGRAALTAAKGE